MTSSLPLVALVAPIALLAVGGASLRQGGLRPRALERLAARASVVGVLVAVPLASVVLARGTLVSPLLGAAGLGLSLRLDALSVSIFTMVTLLAVVIVRFSRSYLDGDPRQGVFLGRLAVTVASVQLLVLAGNLVLFGLAWVATSLSLHRLLVFYPERPGAVVAARKKFIAARIGDVSLCAAGALLYAHYGTGDLGELFARAASMPFDGRVELAAALIAIAALFKSAQFPTHGWLVEVMETPTPVSALLHAGILNAGPFLAMRFAAVLELATVAPALLVLVGGFTALFASTVLLTQPSIKVALGYSSAAHMGFMLLVCGLGAYPAAVLHLVAHSFYKAHAFLSSGSVVDVARAARVPLPRRLGSPVRLGASLVAAVAVYAGLAAILGLTPSNDPALIAVGAILVMGLAQLLAPAIDAAGSLAGVGRTAALALVVGCAFFGLEEAARHLLVPALPPASPPSASTVALSALVLVSFGAAVAVQMSGVRPDGPRLRAAYVHLRNGLYANAAFDRLVGALRI